MGISLLSLDGIRARSVMMRLVRVSCGKVRQGQLRFDMARLG